ncbi:hypothetical protein BDR26DRAFT_937944 [Obelidium mucronatum]|nr:hypothetical protein BDR26DRAFT_937944 [Obelidium mucronatum]
MSPLTRLRANPQEIVDPTKAPWPSRCAKPGSRRQAPKLKQGGQTKATEQTKAITASQVVLSNGVNSKKPKATICVLPKHLEIGAQCMRRCNARAVVYNYQLKENDKQLMTVVHLDFPIVLTTLKKTVESFQFLTDKDLAALAGQVGFGVMYPDEKELDLEIARKLMPRFIYDRKNVNNMFKVRFTTQLYPEPSKTNVDGSKNAERLHRVPLRESRINLQEAIRNEVRWEQRQREDGSESGFILHISDGEEKESDDDNKQQAKTAKGAPKKSMKTVKTVATKTRREPFKWLATTTQALLDYIKEKYADIFSKSIATHLKIEITNADVSTLTGDSCRSKWKALRGRASAHADMLQGRTGTGAAAEDKPEPPYFRELLNIMGKSVAAKGAYQQRDSINRGLRLRPDDKHNEEQDDADTEDEGNTTLSYDHLFGDQSFADGDLLDYNNAAKCSDSDKLAAKVAKNKAITDKLAKMKEALKIKPPTIKSPKPSQKKGVATLDYQDRIATSMEKRSSLIVIAKLCNIQIKDRMHLE